MTNAGKGPDKVRSSIKTKEDVMKTLKRIQATLALGLALLTTARPALAEVPKSWTGYECAQKAEELYRNGEDKAALEYAQAAVARDPEDWEAHQVAGYAAFRLGDKAASAASCRKSLALHPENTALRSFVERNFPSDLAAAPGFVPDLSPLSPGSDPRLRVAQVSFGETADLEPAPTGAYPRGQWSRQVDRDLKKLDTTGDFLGGFLVGLVAPVALGAAGAFLGERLAPAHTDSYGNHVGSSGLGVGITLGYLTGAVGGTILITHAAGTPEPKASLLEGRSTAYIEGYSREFRERGREKKHHEALAGSLAGVGTEAGVLCALAGIALSGLSFGGGGGFFGQ
jgi:hypothetical protein